MKNQIIIDDLIPFLKSGWIAYGEIGWTWYSKKPTYTTEDGKGNWKMKSGDAYNLCCPFYIKAYRGSWKDSLERIAGVSKMTQEDYEKWEKRDGKK